MNLNRFTAKNTFLLVRGVALTLAVGLAAPALTQPVGIPSMGSASSAELSPGVERTLGDAIMEQGRRDPSYIDDPDVSQYLTDMGRNLVAHASGGAQHISVFAVRDPQINAFALPGGYIGINSGLVVSAGSESELASVVAHEIGHVLQRHVARGMTQQSRSNHIMLASLAAALLAGLSGNGNLAMGMATFGQAAAIDQQLGFSRQAEQEADRIGFGMMSKSGFDPRGMAQMFGRLSSASRLNEGAGGGDYVSTHPLSVQRLSDIENRVRESPAVNHKDSGAFWYVRAKLRVIQARDGRAQDAAAAQLQQETRQLTGVAQSAAWYGLAYAAWQKQDLVKTRAALQEAQKNGLSSPEIASLNSMLALKQGDGNAALTQARAAWARWPSSQGVALTLASALQSLGHDQEAIDFLAQRIKQWPDWPRLYQLQAQGLERLGQAVEARRAMAVYYEKTGALPTAVEQLQQARGLSKDFYIQSELDVNIRTLKERLKSDRALLERFKS